MNNKLFSMLFTYLKRATPVMVVLAVVLTALNFGTYDPYHELSSLTPHVVEAEDVLSGLVVPVASIPAITSPALSVPAIETSVSTISVSETSVSAPEVTAPIVTTVESSNAVVATTVPTVTSPSVVAPELTVSAPEVTAPTVPEFTTTTSGSYTSCKITATETTITAGSNVTLNWTTSGFATVTINGVSMSAVSGSYTFTNVQANTTYTLIAKTADGKSECKTSVTVLCLPPVVVPSCTEAGYDFTAAKFTWDGVSYIQSVSRPGYTVGVTGDAAKAYWTSAPAIDAVIAGTSQASRIYTGGTTGSVSKCDIGTGCYQIKTLEFCGNDIVTPPAPTCTLAPTTASVVTGDALTLQWTTTNAASVSLTNFGTVPFSGATSTGPLTTDTVYTLSVLGTNGQSVQCQSSITVTTIPDPELPRCVYFTATPASITAGGASVLSWATENATRVAINNAVGEVSATGTLSVSPIATTSYTLTVFGENGTEATCATTVTVTTIPDPELPRCVYFTATPASLPVGGGTVALSWATDNASAVTISPVLGAVGVTGSSTVALTATTNFVLTATEGINQATCAVTVPVATTPVPLSCAANATFSASPTSITSGSASTLAWTTTGVTGVSFDNGITATGLSGSVTVAPTTSTTYTMTITDGVTSATCPVAVTVTTSGGGGGGSSTPRCEFSVSDNKISLGDSVKLTWDTSRATSLSLEDTTADDVLITTDGLSTSEKERLYDGSLTVSPKKDTTYVLTVKRSSKTRTCTVEVDVEDTVVVKEVRDQKPLVSGIALTSVPYTGFEAGPILTLMFYVLLMAWALYIAYLLVIRRDALGGITFATTTPTLTPAAKNLGEAIKPEVFVAAVQAPTATAVPINLPTQTPIGGYAAAAGSLVSSAAVSKNVHVIDDETMTAIENHAHGKHVLLSSDAIRHFVATTNSDTERMIALDAVIAAAKAQFPAEDGWIVINEKRMQELCTVCAVNQVHSSTAPYTPAVIPEGAGSLAEAIVTGNVVAAYELIGNRPMFALADAAADLDAVYRLRRGEEAVASELLMKETAAVNEAKILAMIQALTSALDGTYTDEASAVKMAIMKAIKAVA